MYRKHTSLGLHKTSHLGVCEGPTSDGPRVAPEFGYKSVYYQSIPLRIYQQMTKIIELSLS